MPRPLARCRASSSNPEATVVEDIQRTVKGIGFQKHNEFLYQVEDRVNALIVRPEDNDTRVLRRWKGSDVPKAAVECDEASRLTPAHLCDLRVCYTTKLLLKHGRHIVASCAQEPRNLIRQVFVSLESDCHAEILARRASGRQFEVLFASQLRRVGKRRRDRFRCQRGILGKQPLLRHAGGEIVQDD